MGCSWSSSCSATHSHAHTAQSNANNGEPSSSPADPLIEGRLHARPSQQQPVKDKPTAVKLPPTMPKKMSKDQDEPSLVYKKLPPHTHSCRVVSVYDGDTITVVMLNNNKKHRVRFLGIDTPELVPLQAYALQAKAYTERKCPVDSRIWLQYEPDCHNQQQQHMDRFGRLLAWVWVRGSFHDHYTYECVNEGLLLQEGLATVYTVGSRKLHNLARLLELQSFARRAGRGVWKHWIDRQVVHAPNGNAYHRLNGNCEHLKRTKVLTRVPESVALDQGRHACRTCWNGEEDENKENQQCTIGLAVSVY